MANEAISSGIEVPCHYTEADLAAMPAELPTGTILYELHRGRIVTLPPSDDFRAAVRTHLVVALKIQGEDRGVDKARGRFGTVLGRNPDHVLAPDGAFILNTSLPVRRSRQGSFPI